MSDPVERLDEQREAEIFRSFNRPTATRWDDADIDCLLRILRRERSRIAELEGEIASLENERDVLRRQREQAFENASKWAVERGQMQGERDAASRAAFEKAAALLDMVAAADDDSAIGEEAADAFNAGGRRDMSDRLCDWNAVLARHIREM